MPALPGTAYLYQGEELGLPEVLDLPDPAAQDPTWFRTGGTRYGRDGCRVPIPWEPRAPAYGFSPYRPRPGCRSPPTGTRLPGTPSVATRVHLELYRRALSLRSTTRPRSRLASMVTRLRTRRRRLPQRRRDRHRSSGISRCGASGGRIGACGLRTAGTAPRCPGTPRWGEVESAWRPDAG